MGGGETGVALFGVGTVPRDSVPWLFALGEGFEVLKMFVEMVILGGGKEGVWIWKLYRKDGGQEWGVSGQQEV